MYVEKLSFFWFAITIKNMFFFTIWTYNFKYFVCCVFFLPLKLINNLKFYEQSLKIIVFFYILCVSSFLSLLEIMDFKLRINNNNTTVLCIYIYRFDYSMFKIF